MSCHGCATKFGFFCREQSCGNCGFSFCNKCLGAKCLVPKFGSEQRVCCQCFTALTQRAGEPATNKEYSPPAAFLRRLESLEDPNRPPIIVYQQDQRMLQLKTGLAEPDRLIAERLERLREDVRRKPVASEEEVARRLARLKSQQQVQEEDTSDQTPEQEIAARLAKLRMQGRQHSHSKVGSEAEMEPHDDLGTATVDEVTMLLAQIQSEMKVASEEGHSADSMDKKWLDSMLSTLQAKHADMSRATIHSEDEECEVQKIVQWAIDEAKLNRDYGSEEELSSQDEEMSASSDESPEEAEACNCCIICDKAGSVRCRGCSGDVYCSDCFTRGHKEWNMTDHVAVELARR